MLMYFLSQPLEKQSLCDERLSVAWGNAIRTTDERFGAASRFLQGFRLILVRASKVAKSRIAVIQAMAVSQRERALLPVGPTSFGEFQQQGFAGSVREQETHQKHQQ